MKQGLSKRKGWVRKIPVEFFPWEAFVYWGVTSIISLILLLPGIILGWAIPGNLTLNFGIWSTNHPATAMKQQKATCLLQCHCTQCDGERLSDSKKCLSPQISWAPSNRNIPCFASPTADSLPLLWSRSPFISLQRQALLPLSTAEFLLLFNADISGLIPGSLSQESGAEAWNTCDLQETPSLPVFFPTWALHICISNLTSPFCFSISFSIAPFICLFDFPSGCPHRHLFNRFLVKKTSTGRMNMDYESDLQGSVSGLLFSCSQCHFWFILKFWNTPLLPQLWFSSTNTTLCSLQWPPPTIFLFTANYALLLHPTR